MIQENTLSKSKAKMDNPSVTQKQPFLTNNLELIFPLVNNLQLMKMD